MEEKKGMVDMLRRFEEGAAKDEGWLEQLREDEQEDELAAALEGVDIGEFLAGRAFWYSLIS